MKKSLAVKSLSAGLGVLLCSGPATAVSVDIFGSDPRPDVGVSSLPPIRQPLAPMMAPAAAPGVIPASLPNAAAVPAAAAVVPAATPAVAATAHEKGRTRLGSLFFRIISRGPETPKAATRPIEEIEAAGDGGAQMFDGRDVSLAPSQPASPASLRDSRPIFDRGSTPALQRQVAEKAKLVQRLRAEIGKVIVGQPEMVDSIIMALIASEHVLIEGVPGVAKTQAVKAAAAAVSGDFKRIQGTPDKLPADILGAEILQDDPQTGLKTIKVQFGPVFAHLLIVDEINRMPPKTQAALLEAMAEKQVTIGDKTYPLPKPFLVMATQNPIEQEGTYPLPQAQLDRFMLKVEVALPSETELLEIMERFSSSDGQPKSVGTVSLEEIDGMRRVADQVYVSPAIRKYIAAIVRATSRPDLYRVSIPLGDIEKDGGSSPRGAIYLLKAARLHALMKGRAWVGPEDIAAVAQRVLRHRITLSSSASRDMTSDKIIGAILARVPIPELSIGK